MREERSGSHMKQQDERKGEEYRTGSTREGERGRDFKTEEGGRQKGRVSDNGICLNIMTQLCAGSHKPQMLYTNIKSL